MRHPLPAALMALAVVLGGCRPPSLPAATAVDGSGDPVQGSTARVPFTVVTSEGTVTVTPRASFDVQAQVASADRYRHDAGAFLAPVDLALIWGKLPQEPYKSQVNYGQITRYYFWNTKSNELDLEYIQSHSSNMHLIPSSPRIREALFAVGDGDAVHLSGLLVDASTAEGFNWHTSMTRVDSGPGACELVWVEKLQIGDRVYGY